MIARTVAVLLISASTLWGQTTNATLRGSITDHSGAVLPVVTISVKNQGTGEERTTLSDEIGHYQIASSQVGVNFMLNGINLNDISNQQVTFQPSINTVDEFKVTNSTFSAEYGRNSGAIVNVATKSGTNQFHGEVFDYLRNDLFDARNFFDVTKPAFRRNQYGGALGGPIVKDRTFFFFSYEGLKHRQALTLNSGVLTDAQRAAVTDPSVRKLLPLIPVANSGPSTFRGPGVAPVGNNQYTLDINHWLRSTDTVNGYYANQRDSRTEPTSQNTQTVPGFGDTRGGQRQVFTVSETHTFGASTVNEARFGFNRIHITFRPNGNFNPAD